MAILLASVVGVESRGPAPTLRFWRAAMPSDCLFCARPREVEEVWPCTDLA